MKRRLSLFLFLTALSICSCSAGGQTSSTPTESETSHTSSELISSQKDNSSEVEITPHVNYHQPVYKMQDDDPIEDGVNIKDMIINNYQKKTKYKGVKIEITSPNDYVVLDDTPYEKLTIIAGVSGVEMIDEMMKSSTGFFYSCLSVNFPLKYLDRDHIAWDWNPHIVLVDRLVNTIGHYNVDYYFASKHHFVKRAANDWDIIKSIDVYFDEDYHPAYAEAEFFERKYNYNFSYFNETDIITNTSNVDKELFLASYVAHANKPYDISYAKVNYEGDFAYRAAGSGRTKVTVVASNVKSNRYFRSSDGTIHQSTPMGGIVIADKAEEYRAREYENLDDDDIISQFNTAVEPKATKSDDIFQEFSRSKVQLYDEEKAKNFAGDDVEITYKVAPLTIEVNSVTKHSAIVYNDSGLVEAFALLNKSDDFYYKRYISRISYSNSDDYPPNNYQYEDLINDPWTPSSLPL